jgi:hypothetical protein
MHQQEPSASLLPHWKVAPHRTQASCRSGNELSGIIGPLSGVIAGKINHVGVTALRRLEPAFAPSIIAFSSMAAGHGRSRDQCL